MDRAFMRSASVVLSLILFLGGAPAAWAAHAQCSDGIDNDNDGRIDYPVDNDCGSLDDNNEDVDNGIFVSVTDNRDDVGQGDAVIYIITLKQQRDDVRLVDVAFHIPHQSGITYASDDAVIRGGSALWNKVAVFKNNIRRLTVHGVVSPSAKPGLLLVARVTADGSSASDTTMVRTELSVPYPQNQLEVKITDNRQNALPGDTLVYVVTVRNPEKRAAYVHLRVGIPVVLHILDDGGAERFGRDLLWRDITINPDEEKVYTFRAMVDTRAPNYYPIQVVARAGNVVGYDRTIVGSGGTGPVTLFSTITDNRETAQRGDQLTYFVHVENQSGRADTDANVSASIPAFSEFVSATEGGNWDGRNIRWPHAVIASGGSRDFSFTVRVRSDAPDGEVLRATSYVQGFIASDKTIVGDSVGYTSSVERTYQTASLGSDSFTVEKSADRTEANPGETVTYRVAVRNTAGRDINEVLVTDVYDPTQVQIVDRSAGVVRGNRIHWRIPVLRADEVRTIAYTARLSGRLLPGTPVVNAATAMSADSAVIPTGVAMVTTDGFYDGGAVLLPVTGIEDYFGPIEDVRQFLTPMRAAQEGNALPLALWLALIVGGIGAGVVVGRKVMD